MKITDLNGYQIEIPDLNRAIQMAEFFKDAGHSPPHPTDKERQEYWRDFHEKLLKLKVKKVNQNEQPRQ
ncbi:hypothetical protein SAMN05421841_1813 [Chryseobacterium wanjuense]|uniref:3-isopropylmalate dehydratase n=1 Tax=Chryseobacterium wanjuense TaxID=356305 RepID=A0A1I0QCB2_9FLAO|nr:3-isopropylmalate dehydratase [Chryseobacterium wanjuense]SEW24697.1 hypothetical protein SAMN05421841_1813 [Chryseobacterium wanjuense]